MIERTEINSGRLTMQSCIVWGGKGGFHAGNEPKVLIIKRKEKNSILVPEGGRSEYGKQIRKKYEAGEINARWSEIKQYDPRTDGLCNTITTVQKDCEILVCSTKRKRSRASDIPEERPTNKTEV